MRWERDCCICLDDLSRSTRNEIWNLESRNLGCELCCFGCSDVLWPLTGALMVNPRDMVSGGEWLQWDSECSVFFRWVHFVLVKVNQMGSWTRGESLCVSLFVLWDGGRLRCLMLEGAPCSKSTIEIRPLGECLWVKRCRNRK